MKTFTEPVVHLLGRQTVDDAALENFLAGHGITWQSDSEQGGEVLSEIGGRLCYFSFAKPRPGGNQAYIKHILESYHGSVAEHAVWNFVFEGVSRSLTHELIRHRAGMAYSELSQRYVNEEVIGYVVPPGLQLEVECCLYIQECRRRPDGWQLSSENDRRKLAGEKYPQAHALFEKDQGQFSRVMHAGFQWFDTVERCREAYADLVEYMADKVSASSPELSKTEARKVARQTARSVLPNATETKIFVTANARALRHFLEMRCSRWADTEIRILAGKIWEILRVESPSFFSDYEKISLPDGTFELTTPYRKV